jgi:hypothetical protein
LIKETIYSRDNQDTGRGVEYEYDAAGKLLKETNFSFSEEEGLEPYFSYSSAYEYEYDSAGKLIKKNFISDVSNGKATSHTDYTYDEKGNLIIETTYDGDHLQESTEYEYDSNGKLIRSEYYASYGGDFVKEYQYDDQGNLVLERHNGVYGETTLAYEYDGMPYPVKVTVVDDGNTEIEILEYQKITVSVARAEEILEVSKGYRTLTTPVLVIIAD